MHRFLMKFKVRETFGLGINKFLTMTEEGLANGFVLKKYPVSADFIVSAQVASGPCEHKGDFSERRNRPTCSS